MNEEPTSYRSYGVPLGAKVVLPETGHQFSDALAREASERDMAMMKSMNPPAWKPPTEPEVRKPVLPDDFKERLATVDKAIVERGVAIDRTKLVTLGKERFARLLEADHEARAERLIGTRIDLTRWFSMQFALGNIGALESPLVPRLKTAEIYAGAGQDREAAAQILGFDDLWKVTQEPRAVRGVYRFRDQLETLLFGRGLLAHLGKDDRARSPFFVRGNGRRVGCFASWVSVLRPPVASVTVKNPVWSVLQWLSGEKRSPVDSVSLAQEFSGMRAPGQREIQLAEAVWDGFLLNLDSWALWDYVGRRTRLAPDHAQLLTWRKELWKRFPALARFHQDVAAHFYKHVGDHRQFEAQRYRLFIDQVVNDALATISALIAIATADCKPVARFESWILCEQPPKAIAEIHAALAKAFPGSRFQLDIQDAIETAR
jgi:hypothetical protein